jgi:SAM-dependent methyltransferase
MTEEPAGRSWEAWNRDWISHRDVEDSLDAPTLANHIDRLKLDFLGPDLPRAGRALEVGCGSARLLARMGRAAPLELVALDPAPNALGVAERTAAIAGVRMQRVRADALSLPFADGSFDLVLSGGLLEHFPQPEPVLAEMVRILRPGGTFYADVVPRKFSIYRVREFPRMARTEWFMPGVHESSNGPGRYARALERLGCAPPRVRSAGVYPPRTGPVLARLASRLDGTPIADLLGWYFMIAARRGAARGAAAS